MISCFRCWSSRGWLIFTVFARLRPILGYGSLLAILKIEIAVSNWPNLNGICLFDSIPHDSLGAVSSPHLRHFSYHQDVTKAGGKRKPRRICILIKLFLNYLSVRKARLRFSTNICGSVTCTRTFKVRKPESFPKVTEKVQLTQPAHHRREINGRGCPSLPQQHTLPC